MKLLVIRGTNLASLAGSFEVNLEQGPLAHVGLFAITGPTGSGKSTILDAMCLALYGLTPRLPHRGGPSVGRTAAELEAGIKANDTRSLLRRGAASASAEVEFMGVDGQRYKATWSVTRARGKPSGRPQKVERSLIRLADDIVIASGVDSVAEEVPTRVGLTFDQFRRSVLLAQGDFAAFLKAKGDERAELLEKMTQTQRYGSISSLVYVTTVKHEKALEALVARQTALGALPPEQRLQAQQQWEIARAALSEAQLQADQLQVADTWYRRLESLQQELAAGTRDLALAEQAWQEQEPQRLALEQTLAARQVMPWLQNLAKASEALATTTAQQAQSRGALSAAQTRLSTAIEETAAARAKWESAAHQLDQAQPQLQQARQLDSDIERQRNHVAEAAASLQAAQAAVAGEMKATGETELALAAARQAQANEGAWLETNSDVVELVSRFDLLQEGVESLKGTLNELNKAQHDYSRRQTVLEEKSAALRRARDELQQAQSAVQALESALAAAQAAAPGESHDLALEKRDALASRKQGLEQGQRLATELTEVWGQETAIGLRTAALQQEEGGAAADLQKACEHRAALRGSVQTVANLLEEARAIASLDDLRPTLRAEQPCPLCGSTHHPWAEGARPVTQIEVLEARQAQLKRDLDAAESDVEAANKRAVTLRSRLESATVERSQIEQRLAKVQQALGNWLSAATWMGGDKANATSVEEAASWVDRLVQAIAATSRELDAAQAVLAAWSRHNKDILAAQQKLAAARESLDKSLKRLPELQAGVDAAASEASSALQALSTLQGTRTQLVQTLQPSLQRYAQWDFNSGEKLEAVRVALVHDREAVADHRKKLEAANSSIQTLQLAQGKLEVSLQQSKAQLAVAESRHAEARRAGETLQQKRLELFEGRLASEVESQLVQAVKLGQTQLDAATQRESQAAAALAAANSSCEQWGRRLAEVQAELGACQRELEEQLTLHAVFLEAAVEAARVPEEELQRRKRALDEAGNTLQKARHVVEERQRLVDLHGQQDPPPMSREELDAALIQSQQELAPLKAREEESRLVLRRDEQARQESKAMDLEIEQARHTWKLWESLNSCIGSADGKKFRKFAQGLTLQSLLHHANRHLEELAPRYRLLRVPGEELELQVLDRDMGDEVRTINSLSGGETFLASLALALGLASLASRKTLVECLFIDEGFGTLDPETLESAMGVLDGLQASGRKVGIISHVPGLAQQIGARVEVRKLGQGRSEVVVVEG